MLDITFYSQSDDIDNLVEVIDVGTPCYEYLIKSGFAKIGRSKKLIISEDGEKTNILAVPLNDKTRNKFRDFFRVLIAEECNNMFKKLGDSPSIKEYPEAFYMLKTLSSLYRAVGDERYHYLDRGDGG
jgi:hypothetical protein